MIRSMLAAVSGMRNHQTFLDVIGNNIANVNTIGFKASRVLFSDILSQLARNAGSAQEGRGGVNPVQIGLGMQISSADTIHSQGNLQSTGKISDLAIQGEGFFVLGDGTRNFYSRDGSFDLAVNGTLVNPATGMSVQGWTVGANDTVDTTQPLTSISIPFNATMSGQPSTAITVRGNLDAGLNGYGTISQSNSTGGKASLSGVYSGDSTGNATDSYVIKVDTLSGTTTGQVETITYSTDGGATYSAAVSRASDGTFDVGNGIKASIATNANNAVANTYSFTATPPTIDTSVGVYDSLGTLHTVKLTFRKVDNDKWSWLASSSEAGVTVSPSTAANIDFRTDGTYGGQRPAGTVQLTLSNGASAASVDIDLGDLSQLSGAGEPKATANGAAAGSLVSFSIGQTGELTGVYSNGLNRLIGQIATASFANPTGLLKSGSNLFEASANSGDPDVGAPGSSGRGDVTAGYLEMSNVDLALQFTNMIMAERGFQANSRVITASDEMLQDLVNLKR